MHDPSNPIHVYIHQQERLFEALGEIRAMIRGLDAKVGALVGADTAGLPALKARLDEVVAANEALKSQLRAVTPTAP